MTIKNVLIVDDDSDLVELLDYNLQHRGYKTEVAHSGIEAIWRLSTKEHPGCILLDVMMPSPDGYEICHYLKTSKNLKNIPVIMISAKSTSQDIQHAKELGVNAYVTKPFSIPQLYGLIDKVMK